MENTAKAPLQDILSELENQPRGLVGPQAKGANPGMEWIGRLVKRLGTSVTNGGWSPMKFRRSMVELAACAVRAIQWVDKHYAK